MHARRISCLAGSRWYGLTVAKMGKCTRESRGSTNPHQVFALTGVAAGFAAVSATRQMSCDDSSAAHVDAWSKLGASAATSDSTTTRLLILRHGETTWNAEKRIQGQLDVSLNDAGQLQAQQFADRLQRLGITDEVTAVVSSDLTRASSTADAIAAVCPQALRIADPRLREFNFGEYQGKLRTEGAVLDGLKAASKAWQDGNFDCAFPEGESAAAIVARGLEGFRDAARLGSCVVIVTHGGLLKWCAVSIELGEEAPSPKSMAQSNVQDLLKLSPVNCCYSLVLYDHQRNVFQNERCFATLTEGALEDSG